jgi:tetratricopeptide (TPR) repeat protein
VAELRRSLDAGPRPPAWLHGACPSYGEAATFRAFAEVVREHAGIRQDAEPQEVRSALVAAVDRIEPDPADRAWLLSRLGPLAVPGEAAGVGAADREELFGACERFLRMASRGSPVAVVLEDLHFAEPPMAALALHLVRALEGAPVLALVTARDELLDRDDDWRASAGRPGGPRLIRMPRLSDGDVRTLLAGAATGASGGGGAPEEAERALIERAGGNPLFARELVRMLAESRGDAAPDAVPDTVQAVVAARLDLLPPGQRPLVQSASVIGDSFWPGAVASVAGGDPATVAAELDALAARGLVREHQSSIAGEREFSFSHAVIRDVAYGQVPRRNRAKRHVAAARWMEGALGDRSSDRAEALAHHYSVAVDLVRAAGDDPAEDVLSDARRFLSLAGDRSATLDAKRGTEYFLQALELAPPGHPDRAALLVSAARYGRRSGRVAADDVVRMLEEATGEFLERDDRIGAGEACLRLSMQAGARGQAERAKAALARAVDLLEGEPGAEAELALAYATLGEDAALGGRFEEALDWSGRALALPGTDETAIMALQIRGDARCSLGDLDGVRDLEESLGRAEREGLAMDAAVAHSWLAEWRWLLEGPAAGVEEELRGEELGERRGLTAATMWSRAARLGMLYDLGEWDDLLELAGRLLNADVAAGGTQITGLVLAATSPVLVHRGRVDEALARQDEMLAAAREAEDLQFVLPALAAAATAAAATGDGPATAAFAGEFVERAHDRRTVYRELYGPAVLRACLRTGDGAARATAASLAGDLAGSSPRQHAAAVTGRALLGAAGGRFEAALADFDDAESRWRNYGNPVEAALASLGAAGCLAGLGRPDPNVAARARPAREFLRSIGVVDADGPQADAGGPSPTG